MNNYTPQDGISFKIVSQINGEKQTEVVPPHSNTGEPTAITPSALIDALTFTFGELVGVEQVKELPAFAGMNWLPMEKSDLGYKQGCFCDGIAILWDGTPSMGTHVRMMGQACRYLEGRSQFAGWVEFLRSILRYKLPIMIPNPGEETGRETSLYYSAKIARIDAAMDDETGLLNLDRIREARMGKTISSTWRTWSERSEGKIVSGEADGQTLAFGRRDGDSMLRFYDRAAKLGIGGTLIRCELELHDEPATAFCEALLAGAPLGQLTAGIIRGKIEFKDGQKPERAGGSQYKKWQAADWWLEFLCRVEKARLGIAPVVRTLQKGKDWLIRQAAPLIATIHDLQEMGYEESYKFLADLIEEGRRRRPAWQARLFECAT